MGRAEMSKQFDDQVLEELGLDPNTGRRLYSMSSCLSLSLFSYYYNSLTVLFLPPPFPIPLKMPTSHNIIQSSPAQGMHSPNPPEAAPYLAGPPPLAPSHSDVGTPAAHSSPRDYAP
ncbi:hypothetical protein H0G86_003591 [Trichoderma simmonsii]|uniref:Uncharacterized protein n=1 Tax=Trichoderma simmonsii TaxID=1491479 RepID=A0A8G0L8X5_9HYPO|nr:hypothetical protein H0G86_003591 [Trichoderma simmonsii]